IIDIAADEAGIIYALIGNEITRIAPNGSMITFICHECYSLGAQEIETDDYGHLYMISNKRFVENRAADSSSIWVFNTHGEFLGSFGTESGSVISGFSMDIDVQYSPAFISRTVGDKIQIVRYEIPRAG